MKTAVVAFLCSLLTQVASAHCGEAYHLSNKERKNLIAKSDAGDADAASRMWRYHSMSSGNEAMAAKWLDRTAQLGDTEAQRWLAYMIAENGSPHETFGKTPKDAVLKLLTISSKTDGYAAYHLGKRYYEGYFGEKGKDTKAREAFTHAASLHSGWCWDTLAKMLHLGEGGEANQVEAYYYICIDTQCTHPGSVGGKELWVLRRKIEQRLTFDQLTTVWKRVDDYILKERKRSGGRIYPPPLLGTGISARKWNEYLRVTDEFEARHRKLLKAREVKE